MDHHDREEEDERGRQSESDPDKGVVCAGSSPKGANEAVEGEREVH
jgi:hypothetical protein